MPLRARRRGFSHNLRAESGYAKRIALAYHAAYRKGRDLPEREARHVCGANPAGFKRFGNGDGKRAHGRLGERGVAQRFRGSVQAHVGHIEPEGLTRNGEGFRHLGRTLLNQGRAHAGFLRTLAAQKKCDTHGLFLPFHGARGAARTLSVGASARNA